MKNSQEKKTAAPNIIIIYADDLGFGDVGCYGAADIPTPNIDALSERGIRFTDGYATAATCTPSRYSLLTGAYPWRNDRAAILAGDDPMIIDPGTPTLPGMLRKAGYRTAVVGKWHLGLGTEDRPVDWNTEIRGTPNDVGFDESYVMAATNDRVPCVYIDNRHVENLDPDDPISVSYSRKNPYRGTETGRDYPEKLRMMYSHGHDGTIINGVSRIGFMKGGEAAVWDDESMAENFASRACDFIAGNAEGPFFLYYALHQPHVPRIPGPRFAGVTGLGPRGDVIAELDWCVGEIIRTLEETGLTGNTIVIFSSDNGPVLDDGYHDQSVALNGRHKPAGPLRGGKYSKFDGGTRVPFILSWPGTVEPGVSGQLVSHLDFYASFASLAGQDLTGEEAPDSMDVLRALTDVEATGRTELVTEGMQKQTILRQENWAYISPGIGPGVYRYTNIESGLSPVRQLYNLEKDIGQRENLARKERRRTRKMSGRLREIRRGSRTR